jgi:hypothetical protein
MVETVLAPAHPGPFEPLLNQRRWGSRSFGAKNDDPLEAFVFTHLFERLSWLGWGVRGKPQRRGSKPCSWAKYHGKHEQYQEFLPHCMYGRSPSFSSSPLTVEVRIVIFCTPATGTPACETVQTAFHAKFLWKTH